MTTFNTHQIVKGVSFFDGAIDGKMIQSGTVFIEERLDDSKGSAKGFRTVPYPASDSGVIKAIMHHEFPLDCDVTMEMRVTKGKAEPVVSLLKPRGRAASYVSPGAPAELAAAVGKSTGSK